MFLFSVLALEFDGPFIRSAVVRRKPLKYEISHCLQIERTEMENEPLSFDELAMITAQIPKCPRRVVVVNPQVMVLEITMEKKRLQKLEPFNLPYNLKEALRWESEAYTGLPALETLTGYEPGRPDQAGLVNIQVSAFPLADYQFLKETLAEKGFKLTRVYPPEFCFTSAALFAEGKKDKNMVVVSVGAQNTSFTLLEKGRLAAYRMLPAGTEQIRAAYFAGQTETAFAQDIFESWDSVQWPVVVCGPGGLDETVVHYFREKLGLAAEALLLPVGKPPDPALPGTEFAAAVGAGLRELYFPHWRSRRIGVDDGIPLLKLATEKAYFVPATTLVALLILFGAHYLWLKHQTGRSQAQLAKQTQKVEAIRAAVARIADLEKKAKEQEKIRAFIDRKLYFLDRGLSGYSRLLSASLGALRQDAPPDLKFMEIQLLSTDDQYMVAGESSTTASIHNLALALQKADWCVFAKVEEIVREDREITITSTGGGVAIKPGGEEPGGGEAPGGEEESPGGGESPGGSETPGGGESPGGSETPGGGETPGGEEAPPEESELPEDSEGSEEFALPEGFALRPGGQYLLAMGGGALSTDPPDRVILALNGISSGANTATLAAAEEPDDESAPKKKSKKTRVKKKTIQVFKFKLRLVMKKELLPDPPPKEGAR
ncbi:MAG: hypothetical protein C4589_06145 [Peptococcaceae bacterium]|nr:MAG: hypothetical protein C4589_06145 [Peptococcaceae bacterium]